MSGKLTTANLDEIEARLLASMKEDQERMDQMRRLLAALPQNASNAQKARALERIRDIVMRPVAPAGSVTGRFVQDERTGRHPWLGERGR